MVEKSYTVQNLVELINEKYERNVPYKSVANQVQKIKKNLFGEENKDFEN